MTICTHCNRAFSASEALCDDWADPNKAYGCPACGTFFIKDLRPSLSLGMIGGLIGGGIATPAMFILARGVRSGDVTLIVMASIILLAVLIGGVLARPAHRPLQRSPYQRAGEPL